MSCKTKIVLQGHGLVDSTCTLITEDNLAAIGISLNEKDCRIFAIGNDNEIPVINISNSNDSAQSQISFPEFEGWRVWAAEISRYLLYIALIRGKIIFEHARSDFNFRRFIQSARKNP